MKVLITGATGFLGSHVVELFKENGHQIRALVRRTSRTDRLEELGVEIVRGEMKDPDSLRRAAEGMEAVVHAATTMAGPPEEYIASTVDGTKALLKAAEEAGVKRFVFIGSIGVLQMRRPQRRQWITEESPYESDPEFLGPYTRSKMEAELAAREAMARGEMEITILRPGLIYGPRGKWNIARLGYPAGANRYVTIGWGSNPLPVVYVKNMAGAILLAAERPEARGQIFNIVDDDRITQREYLRRLKKEVRPKLKIIPAPYSLMRLIAWSLDVVGKKVKVPKPIRKAHLVACHRRLPYSNEKAKCVLRWRPEYGKERALAETMASFASEERLSHRADLSKMGVIPADARTLKVCLVGAGAIAEAHMGFLDEIPHVIVSGLCDVRLDAAKAMCERFRILHAYDSVETMLEREKPDVVHVLTPPQSHADMVRMAIEKGCHVLVEKPMALNAVESKEMIALAQERGVRLCVDHNHLYDPTVIEARRIVESGALGNIIWVDSYYGFDLGNNPTSRYMLPGGEKHWTFGLPGGLYQNLAPHPISVALEYLGAPKSVEARAWYGKILPHAPTDELRIFLEGERSRGMITVSLATSPRYQHLNIYGTKATLFVDILNKLVVFQGHYKGIPKAISRALLNMVHGRRMIGGTLLGMTKVLRKKWTPYDGMNLLIREFYASLQKGEEPPVSPQEAQAVMEVMDETWRQIGSSSAE